MKNEENTIDVGVDTELSDTKDAEFVSDNSVSHTEEPVSSDGEETTDINAEITVAHTLFDEYESEYPEAVAEEKDEPSESVTDEETNPDSTGEDAESVDEDTTVDNVEESDYGSEDADEDIPSPTDDREDEVEDDPELLAFPKEDEIKTEKPKRIHAIFEFVELFVFTLAAVFIITSFFFKYSIVDGGSMNNTLYDEDKLILYCFMYEPECGDVIVLEDLSIPVKELQKPLVKRVIAVGGQTVRIAKDGVYVDGVKLDEPYVYTNETSYSYTVDKDNLSKLLLPEITDIQSGEYYELVVPEGEIFFMGDHRNDSSDSRVIGTVSEDSVLGKVIYRFAPNFDKID